MVLLIFFETLFSIYIYNRVYEIGELAKDARSKAKTLTRPGWL